MEMWFSSLTSYWVGCITMLKTFILGYALFNRHYVMQLCSVTVRIILFVSECLSVTGIKKLRYIEVQWSRNLTNFRQKLLYHSVWLLYISWTAIKNIMRDLSITDSIIYAADNTFTFAHIDAKRIQRHCSIKLRWEISYSNWLVFITKH